MSKSLDYGGDLTMRVPDGTVVPFGEQLTPALFDTAARTRPVAPPPKTQREAIKRSKVQGKSMTKEERRALAADAAITRFHFRIGVVDNVQRLVHQSVQMLIDFNCRS